jgi:hypothetical protein
MTSHQSVNIQPSLCGNTSDSDEAIKITNPHKIIPGISDVTSTEETINHQHRSEEFLAQEDKKIDKINNILKKLNCYESDNMEFVTQGDISKVVNDMRSDFIKMTELTKKLHADLKTDNNEIIRIKEELNNVIKENIILKTRIDKANNEIFYLNQKIDNIPKQLKHEEPEPEPEPEPEQNKCEKNKDVIEKTHPNEHLESISDHAPLQEKRRMNQNSKKREKMISKKMDTNKTQSSEPPIIKNYSRHALRIMKSNENNLNGTQANTIPRDKVDRMRVPKN